MFSKPQPKASLAQELDCPYTKLLLDLDENIISVLWDDKCRSKLSKSAEAFVHRDSLRDVDLYDKEVLRCMHYSDEVGADNLHAKEVRVICRDKWLEVFERIIAINNYYKSLRPDATAPLIGVAVLTAAQYGAREFIDNVFAKVFGEEITKCFFDKENSLKNFYNWSSLVLVHRDQSKGRLMDDYYERSWSSEMPGLKRDRVYLIDDSSFNCAEAKMYGFQYIHHQTGTRDTSKYALYEHVAAEVFASIHKVIVEAEEYCHSIDPNRKVSRRCTIL